MEQATTIPATKSMLADAICGAGFYCLGYPEAEQYAEAAVRAMLAVKGYDRDGPVYRWDRQALVKLPEERLAAIYARLRGAE